MIGLGDKMSEDMEKDDDLGVEMQGNNGGLRIKAGTLKINKTDLSKRENRLKSRTI